jgi:meiotically up-regulated gene 157 (Mug157) protein
MMLMTDLTLLRCVVVAAGAGHQDDVTTPKMKPGVFESKYELDSLAGMYDDDSVLQTKVHDLVVYTKSVDQSPQDEARRVREQV